MYTKTTCGLLNLEIFICPFSEYNLPIAYLLFVREGSPPWISGSKYS
jgi:hypothetical protein